VQTDDGAATVPRMSEQSLATVQAVSGPINDLGAAFYFTPETLQRGKDLGMKNGYCWYVIGRGGVLGDVDAEVVGSAFAYFEPKLMHKLWGQGLAAMGARDASREYAECCRVWGRSVFADVKEAGPFADLATKVIAGTSSAGMALFAGWKAESLGETNDPAGRAAMAFNVLRELRGCANLIAVIAVGMTPEEAHFTARGMNDFKLFGYTEDQAPKARKALRAKAERITDQIEARAYEVLTAKEQARFASCVKKLAKAASS
jgi:hypothetical protein